MSTSVYLFTSNRMMTAADGIVVHNVRFGFDGPRTLSFGRDIRFDEDNVFNNGDKISLTVNGITVFSGWLLDHDPRLDTMETIEYRAVGPRAMLAKTTHVRNDTAVVVYNAEDREAVRDSTEDWTYGDIFADLAARVPNNIITSITGASAMSAIAPETSFTAMNVDDCMRYITEKAGKFGFYITPSRQLRVVNLATTSSKKVYIGVIGQKVADHSEHDVAQANLNWSIAGCVTKCTIEGARERTEKYIRLTPAWDPNNEKYFENSVFYGDIPSTLVGQDPNDIFRKYTFNTNLRMRTDLISETTKASTEFYTENPYEQNAAPGHWFPCQASIDIANGEVIFPYPIYNWRTKNIGTANQVIQRVAAGARMRCVVEGERLKVIVGPKGTAYTNKGIINGIYIVDESLVKENVARPDTATARDDTSKMTTLADQLLDAIKDEQVTGTIVLDGLDLGWTLEYNVDMENTTAGKWANLSATVLSVTLVPEGTETTVLRVSNSQYIGAGPDYAEIKRRMMVGQAIQGLRTKVQRLENRTSPIIGSPNNTGGPQTSGDMLENAGGGASAATIKETVQQAFNDDYFTIQAHDHSGDSEGGDAYAAKGGALL